MIKKWMLVLLLCGLAPSTASAQVMVLIHGYASNADTWESSGINRVLTDNGWQRAGIPGITATTSRTFYAVELPAAAALMTQANLLLQFLHRVRQRHGVEPLTLVGHSAGGVVGRLALLRGNVAGVSRLITIASPHLGTPSAIQGLRAVNDKPFFCPGPGWYAMRSFLGGQDYQYLKNSQQALLDLSPASRAGLLSWAAHQPHPQIEYHALVRQQGDGMVPAFSQDLNNVPAINGRASILLSPAGHALNPRDGALLLEILSAR